MWQQFWTAQRLLKIGILQRKIQKLVDPFFDSVYICTLYAYVPMLYELSNVYPIHDCVATCHFRSHYAILKVEHKCANVQCKSNAYLLEENTFFPFPGILVCTAWENKWENIDKLNLGCYWTLCSRGVNGSIALHCNDWFLKSAPKGKNVNLSIPSTLDVFLAATNTIIVMRDTGCIRDF